MGIRMATAADAAELLTIYGQYINTSITFEYTLPTQAEFAARITGILREYPYLVWEEDGRILCQGGEPVSGYNKSILDKVVHVGDDPFNLYLMLFQMVTRPARLKIIGESGLKFVDLAPIRHFLPLLGAGHRVGKGDTIILESCEYCNSFLNFFPTVAVILDVDADHLDFFKDLEDIRHSFHQFAALLPSDGTLIINGDIDNYQEIYDSLDCNVITYGSSDMLDYSASNITYDEKGLVAFDLIKNGKVVDHIQLSVTGDHNVSNALASIATAELLQIPMETIKKGILSFGGTDRRFEYKGTFNGVTVVDDYAHHPTEIAATLKAAQHYPHNQVWCVFQPHTYTRTKAFFHEFAEALSHTDHLVLADIYAARETDTLGVSSAGLAEEARKLGTDAHYLPSFEEIEAFLKENCKSGDLLITMGAGDVVKIGEDLLK